MEVKKTKKIWVVLMLIFLLGSFGVAGYFYKEYREITNPDKTTEDEVSTIVDKINKNMDLPKDETPTIATVVDKEKLQDQMFFKNAQNGDKIIIYVKAKKAILWRPSTQRIIEFSPILADNGNLNFEPTGQVLKEGEDKEKKISVIILNGTETNGLADEIAKKIEGISNLEVISKENAFKNDYSENLVVDISGLNSKKVTEIIETIGGKIVDLPEEEKKPEADILIIAGK